MFRNLHRLAVRIQQRRTFLSDAYRLEQAWNKRLATPIIQKVDCDHFFIELEQKFSQSKRVSPIDVDIYVNKAVGDQFLDETTDLLHKLRLTAETGSTPESTGHALIRNYLDHGNVNELLQILNARLSYGVFLDDYVANLAMDKLIKAGDFRSAARIATIHMLQEDFSNPITRAVALFSCFKWMENPEEFEDLKPQVEEVEASEQQQPQAGKKKKKKEVIRIRVKFLRNEFFDDHFDLKDSKHLVGKTFWMIGRELDGAFGASCRLLGLTLYQKYEEGLKLLKDVKEIHKDAVDRVMDILGKVEGREEDESFKNFVQEVGSLQSRAKLLDESLEKRISDYCVETVKQHEANDIESQRKVYDSWIALRNERLEEELDRLKRVQSLREIERLTKDMEEEERKLWFFENEEKIDLQIEANTTPPPNRRTYMGKRKKPRKVDEGYIPPDIDSRKNQPEK